MRWQAKLLRGLAQSFHSGAGAVTSAAVLLNLSEEIHLLVYTKDMNRCEDKDENLPDSKQVSLKPAPKEVRTTAQIKQVF